MSKRDFVNRRERRAAMGYRPEKARYDEETSLRRYARTENESPDDFEGGYFGDEYDDPDNCPRCHGEGRILDWDDLGCDTLVDCPSCGGSGESYFG